MRNVLKSLMEGGAQFTGLNALARHRNRHRIAILAYHNVVEQADAGRGDASLHLPLTAFIAQIDQLARTHDIIDIEDIAQSSHSSRPRAVITFDDAYRGAIQLALPELVRRGLPAVVFVAPGLLGAPSTWWDDAAGSGVLSSVQRDAALTQLGGRDAVVRRELLPAGSSPALPGSYAIADREELRAACGNGIRVGSHTWAHEYLPALSEPEVEDTLRRTLEWLDTFNGPTTRWLALPYGGGTPATADIALRVGHTGVLRIEGGLWSGRGTGHVPRINVPAGMSVRGLAIRTSGLRG